MPDHRNHGKTVLVLAIVAMMFSILAGAAWAHCDRKNGPVAAAARQALETGKFDTIAIWVGQKQEKDLEDSFNTALPVYQMGGKAKALAEQYFMESAVRLQYRPETRPAPPSGYRPGGKSPGNG